MADGEVLINTKIDTSGAKEDLKKLKQELSESADTASASAQKIDDSFEKVDVSGAAEGLGESFEKEADKAERAVGELVQELPESYRTIYQKISQIQADGSLSNQDKVDKIREQYELLGQDQETAMRKAWDAVKYDSETGSRKVIENLQDIAKSAADTGESVEKKVGDAFGNLAKKIGGGLAAAFAVDKIVEFGKAAVELGSDLEEVQNVVDVTFTTMSDKVNAFARDAAAMAGLSETMAKQFVGTFGAMADSFGFAEQEAYEMSTTLTKLAGDVASFYNLDQQEAFNKLKAVFTGETEALKEIGVVMTQTALDAYAMEEGFGKVTSQMTEQEKVALRYQFVLGQLESASGDFIRTQDSWANQTRILTLQWESLQATVGEGLIYAFSPAIQYINDTVMPTLQNMADGFAEAMKPSAAEELRGSVEQLGKTMENAGSKFNSASAQILNNALLAEQCAKKLDELEQSGLDTAESQKQYANAVEYLNTLLPDLNAEIDQQTGLINKNTAEINASIEAMKRRAMYEAQQERYTAAVEAQTAAVEALADAEYELLRLQVEEMGLRSRLSESVGEVTEAEEELAGAVFEANEALSGSGVVTAEVTQLMEAFGLSIAGVTPEAQALYEQLTANTTAQQELGAEIEIMTEAISEQDARMLEWSETMQKLAEDSENLADKQQAVTTAAEATSQAVEAMRQEYDEAKEAARDSIDSQVGLLTELSEKSDKSARQIVDNWKKQETALLNYSANMKKAIDMGLDEALVKQLSDGSEQSIQILNELVNSTDVNVAEINEAFRGVEEAKDTVSNAMVDVQTGMSAKLSAMAGDVERQWGSMSSTVGQSIYAMQTYINGLEGKTVYIDVEYRENKQPSLPDGIFGSTLYPNVSFGNIEYNAASYIPYLAEGAVIPPNAPFTAVLGDQRNGYNLEGPEDMFRGIVREELAALEDLNEGTEDLLRELISVVESIEVGDTTIGQSNERYVDKMRIVRGR